MSEKQEVKHSLHVSVLESLGDGGWKRDPHDPGDAAVAVVAVTLEDGRCDIPHLLRRTGFNGHALRLARDRLKGVLTGPPTDCKVSATEDEIEGGLWWALLQAQGHGFIERVPDAS